MLTKKFGPDLIKPRLSTTCNIFPDISSRTHLNIVLVCYLLEITTLVRVSYSHQLARTAEENLQNVTEPLTWKVPSILLIPLLIEIRLLEEKYVKRKVLH